MRRYQEIYQPLSWYNRDAITEFQHKYLFTQENQQTMPCRLLIQATAKTTRCLENSRL